MTLKKVKSADKVTFGGVPLMRNEEIIEFPADQATLTERYTDEAVAFIKANKDKPFFLYLPHTMPHLPLFASNKFKGKSKGGLYGDVIECIDWSTGQIVDTLKQLALDKNTIVVFTSDNGPWLQKKKDKNVGCALPLRGSKSTTYEGGQREPTVMWAPGKIPSGTVCKEMTLSMDLYPTFAALAGAELPSDRIIDGKNVWPLMSGISGAKTPHKAFFYYSSRGRMEGVRAGKWKLRKAGEKGKQKGIPQEPPKIELYDLESDISEKTNLAEKHPDIVERLSNMMKDFDEKLTAGIRPVGQLY
jgi:arylsulfatase A-like enzyme